MFGRGDDKKIELEVLEALREFSKRLRDLEKVSAGMLVVLENINDILSPAPPVLTIMRLTIMPQTVPVGGQAMAVLSGFDQNGNPIVLDTTYKVAYTAAVPADVSFGTINADGSCLVTGVNADAGDAIVAQVTRPSDGAVITSSQDILTVTAVSTAPVLSSVTLTLTPVAAGASAVAAAHAAAAAKAKQ